MATEQSTFDSNNLDYAQLEALIDAPKTKKGSQFLNTTDKAVIALVPKHLRLSLDDGNVVDYPAGTQDMPRSHAEHWFSIGQGVTIHGE